MLPDFMTKKPQQSRQGGLEADKQVNEMQWKVQRQLYLCMNSWSGELPKQLRKEKTVFSSHCAGRFRYQYEKTLTLTIPLTICKN